ncbi:vacuolar protein sorting protein 18 [Trypanosoma grayi]|uniref:vacuolar protein sorting protein 18 n=1 Tax=Trypanosoma grayi TaxID=71804 RepID=UPI0004F4B3AC|nr:vacuolar protein sorting protein 18 [Trypanosoma grayi]KEG12190.1 vacuolar protein sorting protein 18 [Trypanosoma grayi]
MYVASEALAWFDHAVLTAEHLEEGNDEHRVVRQTLTAATRRRFEAQTLTNCSLNSSSVHAAMNEFYRSVGQRQKAAAITPMTASPPHTIGCRAEHVACPIDHNAEPFAHTASAGGTYAVVTECLPQHLYLFDQANDIAISRLRLASSGGEGAAAPIPHEGRDAPIDESDLVVSLDLDPRGNFCVVRWRSGRAAYYYIPSCRPSRRQSAADMLHRADAQKKEGKEFVERRERLDGDMTPRRFPLILCPSVTGTRQPFAIECIAWDMHNRSDLTTGDIILGSSSGGILLACQLASHGVVAARRLYQFPQHYCCHPIDSVAYAVSLDPSGAPCRHVVLVAQRSRMFVFASPWGRGSALEAAFDACRTVAPPCASPRTHTTPAYGVVDGTTGGSLSNYIYFGDDATGTAASGPASAAIGCHHRAPSSLVTHAGAMMPRIGAEFLTSRLLSQVVILDPRELLPTATSTFTAATRGKDEDDDKTDIAPTFGADELPAVFCWQYGDIITQGVVLLTETEGTASVEESHKMRTHSSLRNGAGLHPLSPRPRVRSPSDKKRLPFGLTHNLLPIGVLSVVSLQCCLQELSCLVQQFKNNAQRPPMFCLVPVAAEKKISPQVAPGRNAGSPEMGAQPFLPHETRQKALFSLSSSSFTPNPSFIGTVTSSSKRDSRPNEKAEEEKIVSFAMGYGHFVVTTTRSVYVFCHLAALPLPHDALEWKNSLIFSQKLAPRKEGGAAAASDSESHATVVCSHDMGRAQVFHLFTTSSIVDLRLRRHRHRCEQYVVQLLDAVCPIRGALASRNDSDGGDGNDDGSDGDGDEAIGEQQRAKTLTAASVTLASPSHRFTLPLQVFWKSPLTSGLTSPSIGGPLSSSPTSYFSGNGPPHFLLSSHLQKGPAADTAASVEETTRTQGPGAVILPHIGVLGGHVEVGLRQTTYYDTDNLYNMALRLSALSPSTEERHDLLPRVRHAYATRLFRQGRFLEAAAQHGLAFDGPPYFNTLLLEFSRIAVDDMEPLILLLLLRLGGYEKHKRGVGAHSVEVSCLASWLISLLLERCNQLGKGVKGNNGSPALATFSATSTSAAAAAAAAVPSLTSGEDCGATRRSAEMAAYLRHKYRLREPQQLLDHILQQYRTFIEWKAICAAVFGIANSELTIDLCERFGHNEEVLSRLLLAQEHSLEGLVRLERHSRRAVAVGTAATAAVVAGATGTEAVLAAEGQTPCSLSSLKVYWMRYASVLMRRSPCRFVRYGLIPFASELRLNPVQLIPALLLYDPKRNETVIEADSATEVVLQRHIIEDSLLEEERVRAPYHAARLYLEHALHVEGYTDDCLLNLLLYFTARDEDDAALTRFFSGICMGDVACQIESSYAYRVCWQFQRPLGCAWLYFLTGRYQEAVQLAMSLRNEQLAMQFIRGVRGDSAEGVRHALWKELATATAKDRQGGSRRALQFVAESEGDLNVSDVLPHLSGDVMLQEFREELLSSVASFGNTLTDLRQTIEAGARDVEVLRRDIETTRCRPLILPAAQRCAGCGQPALTRPFVAFKGCRHVFHKTCFDARRANMEEQLRQIAVPVLPLPSGKEKEFDITPPAEEELECVLCSTRYLRLMLTTPLSNSVMGCLPRLP